MNDFKNGDLVVKIRGAESSGVVVGQYESDTYAGYVVEFDGEAECVHVDNLRPADPMEGARRIIQLAVRRAFVEGFNGYDRDNLMHWINNLENEAFGDIRRILGLENKK